MRQIAISTVILLLAAAAFGQIEHPVSTPVYAPVTRVLQSAIASDGDGFLAIWADQRDYGALFTTRIARDGTVLNPGGTLLANIPTRFAVAWTGNRYLVVWSGANSIIAADLDRDGHLLAPTRTIVTGALMSNSPHPIASNGNITVLMTSSGYSVLDRDERILGAGQIRRVGVRHRVGRIRAHRRVQQQAPRLGRALRDEQRPRLATTDRLSRERLPYRVADKHRESGDRIV
jgi:hypothetical protein